MAPPQKEEQKEVRKLRRISSLPMPTMRHRPGRQQPRKRRNSQPTGDRFLRHLWDGTIVGANAVIPSSKSSSSDDEDEPDSSSLEWHSLPVQQVQDVPIIDNKGDSGRYTGSLDARSGKPHGQGRMIYDPIPAQEQEEEGQERRHQYLYEGTWVTGDWSGFGTLTNLTTGDSYQGGFFDNLKHGLCVLLYADGRKYQGTFVFGSMGKGTLSYPDGSSFWGFWDSDSGLPHGRGKFKWASGKVYDGEFHQGTLHGHGRMTWSDGRWYLGEWTGGQRTGLGMEVASDGALIWEGMFCNGRPAKAASFPPSTKCWGDTLLYRSSVVPGRSTLVGPLPNDVVMKKQTMKFKI